MLSNLDAEQKPLILKIWRVKKSLPVDEGKYIAKNTWASIVLPGLPRGNSTESRLPKDNTRNLRIRMDPRLAGETSNMEIVIFRLHVMLQGCKFLQMVPMHHDVS